MSKKVLVFAETKDGNLRNISFRGDNSRSRVI